MIFTFYIYDRRGKCLYYKEWNRPVNTLADDPDEEKKLMFGMLYSLKELTSKISPSEGDQGLHIMKTDTYTLHHFESVTGMIFILNTDAGTPDMYYNLQHIYNNIYVESTIRNPLYRHKPGAVIASPLFEKKLEEYMKTFF